LRVTHADAVAAGDQAEAIVFYFMHPPSPDGGLGLDTGLERDGGDAVRDRTTLYGS
jgi:hypothetical protein